MDAIRVSNITKLYRSGVGRARVREMLPWPLDTAAARLFPNWWTLRLFKALDDVSLTVPAGTSVGLVGHNGAGKTTLLKAIIGVTQSNSGSVEVTGKMAGLIDAIVGFHPDLTGRENVYLLGAMYGVGRKTMGKRMAQVLDFAEVDVLADMQVKRYSAGMMARLGFAVITALNVDILLVDEVLAVGDARFQRKCIGWLDEYRSKGGTLLFVSHNLGLLRNMTERVVWLDNGRVIADGPTASIVSDYLEAMKRRDGGAGHKGDTRRKKAKQEVKARGLLRWGAGGARVEEVHVAEPSMNGSTAPRLDLDITYKADGAQRAVFCVGFIDETGNQVGVAASPPLELEGTGGALRCAIRPLTLRSGVYFPVVAILSEEGIVRDQWQLDRPVLIDREESLSHDLGPVDLPSLWSPKLEPTTPQEA